MKVSELLAEARKRLVFGGAEGADKSADKGVDDASLEAQVLLCFVLGVSREWLVTHSDFEVAEADAVSYARYVDELIAGRPLAYITQSREFYGLDFYVDERVLIPRPETEMIVDEVLGYLRGRGDLIDSRDDLAFGEMRPKEVKMLDIGTGSLNITASVLRNFDGVFAHAVDVSEDALAVARMNREYHGLETSCEIYQSDLLSEVDEDFFDVIVANLPYVVPGIGANGASKNVQKFEPSIALYGVDSAVDSDGLGLYKKLIQQLREKDGTGVDFNLLAGEFGVGQKDAILELLNKNFEQKKYSVEIKNDLAGIPRIFVVRKV